MAIPSASQRFDIARVMGMTLGLIGRNVVAFSLLTAVTVTLPSIVLNHFLFGQPFGGLLGFLSPSTAGMLIPILVSMAGNALLQGIITRAAIDDLSGHPAPLMDAIRATASAFSLLVGLGILVSAAVYLGLIFLFVPGVLLWVRWCVAVPALAVERTGLMEAMRRSAELTRTHRWAIFGLSIFFCVAWFAVNAIAPMIAGALAGDYVVYAITSALVDAVVTLFATVGVAAIYFELRQLKDGFDVTKVAAVFA